MALAVNVFLWSEFGTEVPLRGLLLRVTQLPNNPVDQLTSNI